MTEEETNFNLPIIITKLAGINVRFLIDSGAAICILNLDAYKRIKDKNVTLKNTDVTIKSISGTTLNITHYTVLPITLDNRQYMHKFYVVNNQLSEHYDAIIGFDFLRNYKFKLCLNTNTLITGNTATDLLNAKHKNSRNWRYENTQNVQNINTETYDLRNIEDVKRIRRQELQESDFNLSHLKPKIRSRLLDLIFEFADIFSKNLYTIGRTSVIKPKMEVDYSELPSSRPYTVPHILKKELKRQLDELERAHVIEKSNSHVSFPIIMVKKKNPSSNPEKQAWRLVCDFRRLNQHLKYPRYKLPIISHLIENLRDAELYSNLDLSSSFWQIPLETKDRDMTTFTTPFGSYRFVCLPQGLSLSSEVFCELADKILAPISDLNISNFIDDFCVGSKDEDDMIYKLRKLFERFREFGLTLNPEKCSFMLPKTEFLGHEISSQGIKPLQDNLKKIKDFPVPNTVKKVRRFHGLISYYRKHIKHFSELAAPLTNLCRKNQKFKWSEETQLSFDTLKQKLITPPILIHPKFEEHFILSCDASDLALGAMLGQKDKEGIIRPIGYFSKKLNPTQCRYTIFEKELMAIVQAIAHFKYYLYGRKFTIRCDNAALTKLSNLQSISDRVARWIAFLSDYQYTFELIKSEENIVADLLSRDSNDSTPDLSKQQNESNGNTKFLNDTQKTNQINKQVQNPHTNSSNNISKRNLTHSHKFINEISQYTEKISTHSQAEPILINENTQNYKEVCESERSPNKENISEYTINGLENLGSSCYMNSILQCLTHCTPFINYLFNDKFHEKNCKNSKFCLACALRHHMCTVVEKPDQIIAPIELYKNLTHIAPHFVHSQQQDAHEFLKYVLNGLKNSLDSNSNTQALTEIFGNNIRSEITCLKCKKKNFTYDQNLDFMLDISENVKSLEDALQNFSKPEILENEYTCKCNTTKVDARIINSIAKISEVATFLFKRFAFDRKISTKINNQVSYPERLNMRPYLQKAHGKPVNYNLQAVVVHSGKDDNSGHYYAYVKTSQNNWYLLDDTRIIKVNITEVLNQKAYLLFYSKATYENKREQHETFTENLNNATQPEKENTTENSSHMFNLNVNSLQIDLPNIEDIKSEQRSDKKTSQIFHEIQNNPTNAKHNYPDYVIKNELLMHTAFIPRIRKSSGIHRIVIPDKYKPHILAAHHMSHFGFMRTYNAIREKYYWENLYADTKHYVQSCIQCNKFKSPNMQKPVPIQRHFIPKRPMAYLSCDYVGPFRRTDKGNVYILTFLDHFTKYLRLYAVPDLTAETTAESFLDFISIFGVPEKLLSDKGSSFIADLFKRLCKRLGVVKLFTTPFHPSCNGASESINRNIKKSLSIFAENTGQWDNYVNYYSLIYNSTVHNTTQFKPAMLQLAYDPLLPTDILNEGDMNDYFSYTDFVEKKIAQLQYTNKKVEESIKLAAEKQEAYQHKNSKYKDFIPGELVYLYNPAKDRYNKLLKTKNYVGPMRIIKRHNKVNYTILDAKNDRAKEMKVHSSRLLPYTPRKPDLDLFHNIVQNAASSQNLTVNNDKGVSKPHAVFDDPDLTQILFSQPVPMNRESVITPPRVENSSTTEEHGSTPIVKNISSDTEGSELSESTEIYTPNVEDESQHSPVVGKTEETPYSFRQRQPVNYYAEKIFDFALNLTN